MEPRVNVYEVAPESIKGLLAVEAYVAQSGLERSLVHLIKVRASLINGCAFCIDMHTRDARAAGETEQRLYGLSAWRECPFYTDRERAALEWADAVTMLTDGHVPDELFERVRRVFKEKDLVDLNMAVVAINAWNRIAIPFRAVPGQKVPRP